MYNPNTGRYEPGWRPQESTDTSQGNPLWQETINPVTGESSLKTHTLQTVKEWCKPQEHTLKVIDMGKRLAECTQCGQEITFTVFEWTVLPDLTLKRRTTP
jgi:hypothetical protein